MIVNPIETTSAHLIWQSPLGSGGSRRRLPVAMMRMKRCGGVSFEYLRDTSEFKIACDEGFNGYTGIPLDRDDTSDAINTLGRRLLMPSRPDYAEYLARSGLSVEHNLSTLSLLAYTGAKLTSDSFSVSDTFEGFDRPFEYIFDVAGRRHSKEITPSPEIGEPVIFRPEPQNLYDGKAIELVNSGGERFGYINACQANSVNAWINEGSIEAKVFRVNGRVGYPRLFVFAHIIPNLKRKAA